MTGVSPLLTPCLPSKRTAAATAARQPPPPDQEALIGQLAEIADRTDNPMVSIRAISAQGRATDRQLELLQDAGLLPAPLPNLAQHIDAQRIARRAVEVLNRHRVPAVVKQDLLHALRGS